MTTLFQKMAAADAAFAADDSIANLDALRAAESAYFLALVSANSRFNALALSADDRIRCEENAADTMVDEGLDHADKLSFVEYAISTADFL